MKSNGVFLGYIAELSYGFNYNFPSMCFFVSLRLDLLLAYMLTNYIGIFVRYNVKGVELMSMLKELN